SPDHPRRRLPFSLVASAARRARHLLLAGAMSPVRTIAISAILLATACSGSKSDDSAGTGEPGVETELTGYQPGPASEPPGVLVGEPPGLRLAPGGSAQLAARLLETLDGIASDASVTWSSSDDSLVTVAADGSLHAVA